VHSSGDAVASRTRVDASSSWYVAGESSGPTAPPPPSVPDPSRRTVLITGQTVPPRRRRSRTAAQVAAQPDRVALWAFLLGLFLLLMAVATANAAPA
jgi:hypothetical protein